MNRAIIVQEAWQFIEREGVSALALSKLAAALGVKAPSLYRHIGSKDQLLQAVNLLTIERLFAALHEALEAEFARPDEQFLAVMMAYRAYAQAHPQTYMLALVTNNEAQRPDETVVAQMTLPIQAIMAEITGEARSLAALRGALALVHGFVLLELNEQLRRGGDLTAAFTASVKAYLRGWRA